MTSIKIRTLTPWLYYILIAVLVTLGMLAALIIGVVNELHEAWIILIVFAVVIVNSNLSRILSRKWTTITHNDGILQFDSISIPNDELAYYYINKAGIGVTQFEFTAKAGRTFELLLPNYSKNADKLEEFLKEIYPPEISSPNRVKDLSRKPAALRQLTEGEDLTRRA